MLYSNNEMVHNETIFGLESTQLKFGRNSLNELGWELSKYNSNKIFLKLYLLNSHPNSFKQLRPNFNWVDSNPKIVSL